MPLIDLDIPAGVYRKGTDMQAQGRWRDASLVRWHDGVMRPVKGWRQRSDDAANAEVRGLINWEDNTGNKFIAGGTYNKLYAWQPNTDIVDITPSGLTAGRVDAAAFTGYGGGFYGYYGYGVARPQIGNILPATSWQLDTWGQYLIALSDEDKTIYEWQLDFTTPTVAAAVSGAPSATGIVVTDERFLFALGADGNPRRVEWSDREDNTTWTPATTNEAGGFELETSGDILLGKSVNGETLILTTRDAHVAKYIGPPYVYSIERAGVSCGGISKRCAASFDGGAAWMGVNSFFVYNGGAAQKLPCEVSDYVFKDINRAQISKVFAMTNSTYNEIWWFYPSAGSLENDRYVSWNYVENIWMTGEMARTAGCDRGSFQYPMMADPSDNKIYEHEISYNYHGLTPYAETGPIRIASGDQIMKVTRLIPDEQTQGDVTTTFKSRFYPNGTERTYGPFTMTNPTSVRFSGRQIRMRIDGDELTDWRVGINRIDAIAGGRR